MTTARIENALVGEWEAVLTFTGGPRKGEHELVRLSFLPDRVIVGTDATNGQLPPAIGEWAADGDSIRPSA